MDRKVKEVTEALNFITNKLASVKSLYCSTEGSKAARTVESIGYNIEKLFGQIMSEQNLNPQFKANLESPVPPAKTIELKK